MRILAVQETDWIDRNPILHHRMLEALTLSGHEVTVVDFDILWPQKGRLPLWQGRTEVIDCHKFFENSSVRVVRPPMVRVPGLGRPSWLAANWTELKRLIRSEQPDVVLAYSISNAYLALRLAHSSGVPFVYHLMDALHTLVEPRALRPAARLVERAVLRDADRVIAVNNALGAYARGMGANPGRVQVLPMGVDIATEPVKGDEPRGSLGIAAGDVVLLFMGWLYTFSGLRELVMEFSRRREQLPNVRLLVVGDGDLMPELVRLRDVLGLRDHLILTGRRPVNEMAGYIAAADFGLLPAIRNATMEHIVPAKVIEYMESGKAVIATRLPGLEAEFIDLPGILYVEQPEQVLDRVAEILSGSADPRGTARQLGSSCRDLMRMRDDWDAVTRRFAQLLRMDPVGNPHLTREHRRAYPAGH